MGYGSQANIDGCEDYCSGCQEKPVVLGDETHHLRHCDSAGCNQQKWQDICHLLPKRVVDEFLSEEAMDKGDDMIVERQAADHDDNAIAVCEEDEKQVLQFMED